MLTSPPLATPLTDLAEDPLSDELSTRLALILKKLEDEVQKRISQKRGIEQRWIDETLQYEGRYSDEERRLIVDTDTINKSTVYMNLTRQKANVVEARLVDGAGIAGGGFEIKPSPVPELAEEAKAGAEFAAQNQQRLLEVPEGDPAMQEALAAQREATRRATELQAALDEARRRAESMYDEIDDQLKACNYEHEENRVKHDAVVLGTGIMKGPVTGGKVRKRWSSFVDEATGFSVYEMTATEAPRPMFYRVDPRNWFPSMSAVTVEESESFFERHLMNPSDLRKLAKRDGFIAANIRKLLRDKARSHDPSYLSEMRNAAGDEYTGGTERYHVWEYHGPLDHEDFLSLSEACYGTVPEDDIDPLFEQQVTVWFCQGEVLKFGIHPLDSGESIYSVYTLQPCDYSIFGYGVPHLIADNQKALCAAWRMMIDNAAAATLPQIVFDHTVEPMDGEYLIYPGKRWLKKSGSAPGARPFETYHFDIRQAELQRIIELAIRAIEQESGIPLMAQVEPASMPTQTAFGVGVLNRSMNIVFGLLVKQFEKQITVPCIRRLYDWNMQFSAKEHIKGDMEVYARGSSTYVLREIQAPNLMILLQSFAASPVLGPALQIMPILRQLARAMLLEPSEVIKSDEKLAADLAAAAEQDGEPAPTAEEVRLQVEQLKAEVATQIAKLEAETKRFVAETNHQMKVMDLEMSGNLDLEEKRQRTLREKMKIESKERIVAADAAVAERSGRQSGGLF